VKLAMWCGLIAAEELPISLASKSLFFAESCPRRSAADQRRTLRPLTGTC